MRVFIASFFTSKDVKDTIQKDLDFLKREDLRQLPTSLLMIVRATITREAEKRFDNSLSRILKMTKATIRAERMRDPDLLFGADDMYFANFLKDFGKEYGIEPFFKRGDPRKGWVIIPEHEAENMALLLYALNLFFGFSEQQIADFLTQSQPDKEASNAIVWDKFQEILNQRLSVSTVERRTTEALGEALS